MEGEIKLVFLQLKKLIVMAQFSKSQKVHLYYGYNIELTIDFLATF